MRIIAGRFKGHRLPLLRSNRVRPTMDRVREAVFSSVGSAVQGARVLELFAGTGAFGFEALSRGADFVLFVDRDQTVAQTLARTAKILGVTDQVTIFACTAAQAVKRLIGENTKFDLVFLDPPYERNEVSRLFAATDAQDLVDDDGLLIVEQRARSPEPIVSPGLEKRFERRYGGTSISMYRKLAKTASSL